MFEELMKTLKGLENRSVSIPIEPDEKGYIKFQPQATSQRVPVHVDGSQGRQSPHIRSSNPRR